MDKLKIVSKIFIFLSALIGILGIISSVFAVQIQQSSIRALIDLYLSLPSMNTAIGITIACVPLWYINKEELNKKQKLISEICSSIVTLLGALTLIEYLFNLDFGTKQFFINKTNETVLKILPGQMSMSSAFTLLIIGTAFLIQSRKFQSIVVVLVFIAFTFAAISMIAYVFQFDILLTIYTSTSIAVNTVAAFIFICASYLLIRLKLIWRYVVSIGFGVAVFLIVLVEIISYRNKVKQIEDSQWVVHTHEVIDKIGVVLNSIKDAEIYLRGFTLTKKEEYIQEYFTEYDSIAIRINELRMITLDTNQLNRIKLFEVALRSKDSVITKILMSKKNLGTQEALKSLFNKNINELRLDKALSVITEMISTENNTLKKQIEQSELSTRHANVTTISGSFASIALLLFVFWFLLRENRLRKKSEEELKESEQQYKLVIESAHEAIIVAQDGMIKFANPRTVNITGYSMQELLTKNFLSFIHEDDRQLVLQNYMRRLSGEEVPSNYSFRIVCNDGSNRVVEINAVQINWLDKPATLNFLNDITERKIAEENIKKSLEKEKELNELRSRFISMASHEFRTPLTAINSAAEILDKFANKLSDDQKHKNLERIQDNVKYMIQLLNDVLLIGKTESSKYEINIESVNLIELCKELIDQFEISTIYKTGQKIKFTHVDIPEEVFIDQKVIRQILENLISNAIKYSPSESEVDFEVKSDNDMIYFKVHDHGIGIPPSDIKKMFEPFHRAQNVGKISGTGLGLVIVKHSVELHGGSISFDSQENIGTTFYVQIPLMN